MADAIDFIKKAVGNKEGKGAKIAGALKNSPPKSGDITGATRAAIGRRLKKQGAEGSALEERTESKKEATSEGDHDYR